MYNKNLEKFLEQIKQKNMGMNRTSENSAGVESEPVAEQAAEKPVYTAKRAEKTQYVYEDVSKRTSNARSYRNVKGKTETVISGAPVNFFDLSSGKFRPIDNTLERRSDGEFSGY